MNKNKNKSCSYCSISSVRYKCSTCEGTGRIEIPKDIKWHSNKLNDFTIIRSDFITCDNCKGKGWILVPPIIAEKYPENILH